MAIAKQRKTLTPQAFVAGLVTVGVVYFMWRKSETSCEEFHDIYKTPGPIYLTDEAQEEAFSFARLRMRSVAAAGELITKQRLQLDIANEISPSCEWANVPSDTSIRRRVWDSFGHIADYVHDEFHKEEASN